MRIRHFPVSNFPFFFIEYTGMFSLLFRRHAEQLVDCAAMNPPHAADLSGEGDLPLSAHLLHSLVGQLQNLGNLRRGEYVSPRYHRMLLLAHL